MTASHDAHNSVQGYDGKIGWGRERDELVWKASENRELKALNTGDILAGVRAGAVAVSLAFPFSLPVAI
jgi:hypothetical protein